MEQYEEKNGKVQLKALERHVPIEMTAEISLPDYRSEIRRLLWVRPSVMPPERFVGGGKADFSGSVRFCLLYVGPDGALYAAESEEGYSFSVPMDGFAGFDTAGGVELCGEPVADAVISRVTGPRRLSVRCRMHATVRGYAEKNLCLAIRSVPAESLCRLCEVKESARLYVGGREGFSLADQMPLQEAVRVVTAHGAALLSEVVAGRDTLTCKGEVLLTLLLEREGETGALQTLTRRLPFEQECVLEGVTPECLARACVTVGEITAVPEEGQLTCEVQAVLCGEACREEAVLVCRDAFLPGHGAECKCAEECLQPVRHCGIRNLSISGERPLAAVSLPAGAELLDATAEVEITEKAVDGARSALVGTLCTHVLYRAGAEYGVCDAEFPIRVPCEQGSEGMQADVRVASCRMSCVGDTLRADAELQLSLLACGEERVSVLCEAKFIPAAGDSRIGDPEVYYPAEGETLWSVAKRYAVSPEVLAASNGVEAGAPACADSLGGKRFLLIP